MKSIKLFLTSTIISVIVIVVFTSTIQSYQRSLDAFEFISDKNLELFSGLVADVMSKSSDFTVLKSVNDQDLVYRVWSKEKNLLGGYDIPQHVKTNFTQHDGYANFAHFRWKTRMLYSERDSVWIWLAEKQEDKLNNIDDLIIHSLLPFIFAIPVIGMLIYFLVNKGLQQIKELSEQISSKAEDDLTPIKLDNTPIELDILRQSTNSLFKRLNTAFNAEKRLSSNAAHELRTPITGLITYVEYLISTRKDDEEIEKLLTISERLAYVTEQILTINRLSPETINRDTEFINLESLIQEVVANKYDQICEKEQTITVETKKLNIKANRFAVQTMLSNILGNAIKYTPANGCLSVKVFDFEKKVVIEVHDDGPGIPKESRSRVIERYYRLDGDRNNSEIIGCGLGLSIVSDVVDALEGSIEILDSSFNTGTCIRVQLRESKEI